jgi:hypothetical protein
MADKMKRPNIIGAWLSLVERCVRDAEVAGSNPVAPTIQKTAELPSEIGITA